MALKPTLLSAQCLVICLCYEALRSLLYFVKQTVALLRSMEAVVGKRKHYDLRSVH